jgi:Uma2 family endonuclease
MSVPTSQLIEAVTHLPSGGRLTLCDVGWDEYEALLEELGDAAGVRIGYDNGRLEVITPSPAHEHYKSLLHDLVLILGDELEAEILSYGSATWKLEKSKGAEADEWFYIQRAALVAARRHEIDLRTSPPPDLVIEIDLTRDSSTRLSVYASLGVPEVWRYDGERLSILGLTLSGYTESPASLAFPFLTPERMMEYLANCSTRGPRTARQAFRDWVRSAFPR